jgi:hypothetical protein
MTTPVLPRDLYPVTSPSGYSYASAQGVSMTQVEGGFNRYALDFDRGTRLYNVSLACTAGHLQVWELFYLRIIKKGVLAFEMPLDSGTGLEQHIVNIIPNSVNTTETDGNNFVVTFQVEAESKIYDFTDEGTEAILSIWETSGDVGEFLDRLALFTLEETLVLV